MFGANNAAEDAEKNHDEELATTWPVMGLHPEPSLGHEPPIQRHHWSHLFVTKHLDIYIFIYLYVIANLFGQILLVHIGAIWCQPLPTASNCHVRHVGAPAA
jgi:hypothetical protein